MAGSVAVVGFCGECSVMLTRQKHPQEHESAWSVGAGSFVINQWDGSAARSSEALQLEPADDGAWQPDDNPAAAASVSPERPARVPPRPSWT
jgi:hypothetical protein